MPEASAFLSRRKRRRGIPGKPVIPMLEEELPEVLCLQCAATFPLSSGQLVICPDCSWSISISDFEQLRREAKRVAKFGHQYRQIYQEQLEREGEVTTAYFLSDPPEWLILAAMAALTGVIGNAAYDVVKQVIGRLLVRHREKRDCLSPDFRSDAEIEVFIKNAREFVNGMTEVNVTVRQWIEHEELTDSLSKESVKAIVKGDFRDVESMTDSESAIRRSKSEMVTEPPSRIDVVNCFTTFADTRKALPRSRLFGWAAKLNTS